MLQAFGANAFGQGINVFIQLASLPIFLAHWDTGTYGTWLMLSAVPAYLAMADVGMVVAAGNRMTIAMGASDLKQANSVFQSAGLFMVMVCGTLAIILLPLVLLIPVPGWSDMDTRVALAALAATVLLNLLCGLPDAVFRATGRYSQGVVFSSLLRLAEWAGGVLGLIFFGTFAATAVGAMLVRALGLLLLIGAASTGRHGIEWGLRAARLHEAKAMLKPATSFMLFPLANAISIQGMTLMVGQMFGPAAVAVISTYRTLARTAVQLTSMFSHALWPEFSRLYGAGGAEALRSVYRRAALWGCAAAVALSLALGLVSPWVLTVWTHGTIQMHVVLMALMLSYAAIAGAWHVPRVLLMATNHHVQLAISSLATACLGLVLVPLLAPHLGLDAVGYAVVLSELAIALVCIYLVGGLMRFDGKASPPVAT